MPTITEEGKQKGRVWDYMVRLANYKKELETFLHVDYEETYDSSSGVCVNPRISPEKRIMIIDELNSIGNAVSVLNNVL